MRTSLPLRKQDFQSDHLAVCRERFLRGLLPFQKAERKTRDGGVLHNAFFNERNFHQLAAPAKDLKTFCEARGGKFLQLASAKISATILATPALNKNDVFYQNWEMYRSMGFADQLAGLTAAYEADLYDRAVAIVLRDRKASTSYIQRRLAIGYNRAASIIEKMEQEGVVGPANHAGKREILVPEDEEAAFR